MSVRPQQQPDSQFINNLLSANFQMMEGLGEPVLKPFLQVSTHCVSVIASRPSLEIASARRLDEGRFHFFAGVPHGMSKTVTLH